MAANQANSRGDVPTRDVLAEVLIPTLEVGAASGSIGLLFGGAAGILRSAPPMLFAVGSGIQCATLGSSFYVTRLYARDLQNMLLSRSNDYASSGLAGCVAGGMAGALRSRANVLPGAFVIGMLGLGFQAGLESFTQSTSRPQQTSILERIANSRWVPLKPLPDDEYEKILKERLLKTEAELSVVNDEIRGLKAFKLKGQPRPAVSLTP